MPGEAFSLFGSKKPAEDKYAGQESYGDPKVLSTGVVEDLRAIGAKGIPGDLDTLLKVVTTKGQPVDDKQMVVRMEMSPPPGGFPLTVSGLDGEAHRHHRIVAGNLQNAAQADLHDRGFSVG